ncbi:MAG: hypothetical protein JNJ77_08520 [Planctomycetia bacterium]|nr:hypothetical protein [Planctomycetia bacterium]
MFRSWLPITAVLLLGQISTLCGQENYSTRQVPPNDQSPLPIQQTNSFIPSNNQTIFTGWDGKDDAQTKNGTESKNGKEDKKFEPKHIRDNGFLVEEAFNQEPGEVQHIFNWVHQWDRTAVGKTRDFAFSYTMELPLGSQTHQFSFLTQIQSAFDAPIAGQSQQPGGIGDTFIN